MLEKIIGFSIRNKIIIAMLVLGLVAWGGFSLSQLPIDALPDITNNQVQVLTTAPTLAAQEVERSITFPIEMAVSNIPDLVEIRSVSRFGLSAITIVFEDQVDIYKARQLVGERLTLVSGEMPPGVRPELAPVTTGLGEIYQYVLYPQPGYDTVYSPMDLRTMQDWIVRRQLLGTPGVADVSSLGGYLKQYEIALNPSRLHSLNISIGEIFAALEKNNENTGGAYIDRKPNAYFIRGLGLVNNLADIEKIVVRNNAAGIPVLIRDVAQVQLGYPVRYGAMTRNNEGEVVGGIVLMLKDANSAKVIENVKQRIQTIQKALPEGVKIEPFLDRTTLVEKAISTVRNNLIEGALIVIFVLVLMLGNLRAGLVVASVIPLSLLFAFGMMNIFGVSGNLMSLGAIDFGLIVDGAVIIVEGVLHHIVVSNQHLPARRLTQQEMDKEVKYSATKIMNSAAFGMIIILIVYLPILALVGVEGKMFRPMAQTVSFAILGALLLSLTYVPMMASVALSKKTAHKPNISDRIIAFLQRHYDPVIRFALGHKFLVLAAAALMFGLSLLLFSRMGGEFIPRLDEGDFALEVRLMPGSSLSQTVENSGMASEILLKNFPEVKETIGKIGSSEIPTDPMPIEANDLMVILKDKSEWTSATTREELADKMAEKLAVIPGVEFGFQQPIEMRFNELMTGARQDVAIKIFGEDLDVLAQTAQRTAELIAPVQGVEDIYVEQVTGLPQIQVQYIRDKIAQYGLTISDVNTVLRTAFAGETAGVVYEGERHFDMVVRMEEDYRQSIEDVRTLFVPLPSGNQIPLEQVAKVSFEEGPMQISREDAKRRITVGFNVRGKDVESVVNTIHERLDRQLKLSPGYYITYGGQFENLVEARQRLMVAVPAALLLIFVLLFFTFGSLKQGLLIFTAIPLSAIGGILALWLRDMPFSISAGVGFIALFGVAVLNGIVLIGYFNQLEKNGVTDVRERVLQGTHTRLRPVLMTALVASLGFLPMALSNSAGAEVQKPLATVVIGGLITATLLTLVVLPVLYTIFTGTGKNNTPPALPKAALIFLLLSASLFLPQQVQAQTTRTLTLQEAEQEALQQNFSVRNAQLELELNRHLQKAAVDLSKTEVALTYGQYNSNARNDNHISIMQNFAFPTVYVREAQVAKARVQSAAGRKQLTEAELRREVRHTYYNLLYTGSLIRLLQEQDSLLQRFVRAAELRYQTGETALLEKTIAATQLMDAQNRLFQARADERIFEQQLQTLLQTNDRLVPSPATPAKRMAGIPETDTAAVARHPYYGFLQQELIRFRQQHRLERARFLPDLRLGYFSQTLIGTENIYNRTQFYSAADRFTGFEAGIALPLWYRPFTARAQAARVQEQIAQNQLQHAQISLQGQLAVLAQQLRKQVSNLDYYERQALPQAEQILRHADMSFRAGEIGYVEFVQAFQQAMLLRTGYAESLNLYNQTVIELEFMSGQ